MALTKIDTEVLEKTPAKNTLGDTSSLLPMSTFSLRSIVENVNPSDGRFLKYTSDGFFSDEQRFAKQNSVEKQNRKYSSYTVSNIGDASRELANKFRQCYKNAYDKYINFKSSEEEGSIRKTEF